MPNSIPSGCVAGNPAEESLGEVLTEPYNSTRPHDAPELACVGCLAEVPALTQGVNPNINHGLMVGLSKNEARDATYKTRPERIAKIAAQQDSLGSRW